jgi:hypothetical protein
MSPITWRPYALIIHTTVLKTALPYPPLLSREHVFLSRRALLRVLVDHLTGQLTDGVDHSLFGAIVFLHVINSARDDHTLVLMNSRVKF